MLVGSKAALSTRKVVNKETLSVDKTIGSKKSIEGEGPVTHIILKTQGSYEESNTIEVKDRASIDQKEANKH